jgi:cell division protein FtsZ
MGLEDVEAAAMLVQSAAHPDANIIFGASFDDSLDDEIVVTVIATGFDEKKTPYAVPAEEPRDSNLFTDARDRMETEAPKPAATPAQDEGEDPFDTIFRIFNKP